MERIGTALGTYWDRDSAESLFDDPTMPGERPRVPDRVTFPLALILKPEFRDTIKNMFGRRFGIDAPGWAKERKEEVVDMFDMSKEEFKKMYGQLIGSRAPRVD